MSTGTLDTDQSTLDDASLRQLGDTLRGSLLQPSDPDYEDARKVFNAMIDRRPALIARCAGVADAIAAVRFARANDLPVSVRGGGHNVTGSAVCNGGLVIDLSGMKGLRIDPVARTIRAEPGLTWGEVNQDLQTFGLAAAGGYVSTTGVPGLTLGGGLGWLVRKHGLACDNLRSADVVTADGELVHASATENGDLFWGLRGGGGNFGIVTSFEFDVHQAGIVLGGLVIHPLAGAREVLQFWRGFARSSPEELTSGALLLTAPAAPFIPPEAHGAPIVAIYAVYAGSLDAGEEALRPLREFGPPVADLIQPMPYSAVQTMADVLWPPNSLNYWKSGFLGELADGAINALVQLFATAPSPLDSVVVEHNGDGAMSRIGPDETAFSQRAWPFNLLVTALWTDSEETEANVGWARRIFEAAGPYTADAAYLNYVGDEGAGFVRTAYGERSYERLVALKNRYDPTNFFRFNQNISPG